VSSLKNKTKSRHGPQASAPTGSPVEALVLLGGRLSRNRQGQSKDREQKEVEEMSARHKINHAFFNGGLLLASIAGFATGSWGVFAGVLAVSVALDCYSGNIRLKRRGRKP
jgi:hypothetical protein